jgi:hypothetical protein
LYVKTYGAIHPGEITEVDHNANLESSVTMYFWIAYPLLLATFGWLFWRLTGRWFGHGAAKPLEQIAPEDAHSG